MGWCDDETLTDEEVEKYEQAESVALDRGVDKMREEK